MTLDSFGASINKLLNKFKTLFDMSTFTVNGKVFGDIAGRDIKVSTKNKTSTISINGKTITTVEADEVLIKFEGDLANLECTNAEVAGNVTGNVEADNLDVSGNVGGNIKGDNITCGNVGGNVEGDIVNCGKVTGSVKGDIVNVG